ncbi:MAG: mechanosensitive ion channel family protein [Labilithrix sp.]
MDTITTFLHQDYALSLVGLVFAAALLLLVRALLPREDRSRARIATIYLSLALFAGFVLWVLPQGSSVTKTIEFFWWFFVLASIGRSGVLLLVDVFSVRRTHRQSPRIFRDLTQAVVYVIVVMMTLRAVGVEPGSLLTTSALLTAVVGLALQDTLGNLVSGLALQVQRPFEVGDWIQFESDTRSIGQVTEVNWRATTVMTSDLVELIVPNATLAKAAVRNFSRPSQISRRCVTVQGPYEVPPHRVQEAIVKTLETTPGVIADPPPWVQTDAFSDSGIEYRVWFFTDNFAAREATDGLVRDRVWYALSRASIGIPFPIRTVHMHQVSEESKRHAYDRELDRLDNVLRAVDFLDLLSAESHRSLAAAAEVRLFGPGEIIVKQGEQASELFIIDRGEVDVEVDKKPPTLADGSVAPKSSKSPRQLSVARLGPGKFFGEMALLTGEARAATVRAATECALIVVGHKAFHDTIVSVPEVVAKMSALVAQRHEELEAVAEGSRPSLDPTPERSARLLSQIRAFFKLSQ